MPNSPTPPSPEVPDPAPHAGGEAPSAPAHAPAEAPDAAPDGPREGAPTGPPPPEVIWAHGFLAAARNFATERKIEEVHIEVTLANGETFPVISVGPGGPPGFIGFGVETEGLREEIDQATPEAPVLSPKGYYVPIGSVAKVTFSAEIPEERAVGFVVDQGLDES